jgi:hypothetical protein
VFSSLRGLSLLWAGNLFNLVPNSQYAFIDLEKPLCVKTARRNTGWMVYAILFENCLIGIADLGTYVGFCLEITLKEVALG